MQSRNKQGRWKKTKGWTWRIAVAFIIALALSPFIPKRELEFNRIPMVQNVAEAEQLTPEIIEKMKKDVIERLRNAETKGHEIKDGEVFYTHDSTRTQRDACMKIGGKRPIDCDSWGALQIKIPTAQRWYSQLYGKEITEMEALTIVLDYKKASQLAIDAITKIEGSIYEWTGARSEKEFYDYVVPLIREYEK